MILVFPGLVIVIDTSMKERDEVNISVMMTSYNKRVTREGCRTQLNKVPSITLFIAYIWLYSSLSQMFSPFPPTNNRRSLNIWGCDEGNRGGGVKGGGD